MQSAKKSWCVGVLAYLLSCAFAEPSCAHSGALQGVMAIQGGQVFTCALMQDQRVQCWGNNDYGELGDGGKESRSLPGPVSGLSNVQAVASGDFHACAIDGTGGVSCWGWGGRGQLGNSSTASSAIPSAVGLPAPANSLALGASASCALLSDHRIFCWGSNSPPSGCEAAKPSRPACLRTASARSERPVYGLAPPQVASSVTITPAQVDLPAGFEPVQIAAGGYHDCARSLDHRVACWAEDGVAAEVLALQGVDIVDLSVGYARACVVTQTGEVQCWDLNVDGAGAVPTSIGFPPGTLLTRIVSGYQYHCALASDAGVWCWGSNGYGESGNEIENFTAMPMALNSLSGASVMGLGRGYVHSCAVTADHEALCWGAAHYGQLGAGGPARTSTAQPAPIPDFRPGGLLALGDLHTCATNQAGALACWGGNGWGQLGLGNHKGRSSPVVVPGLPAPQRLALGSTHSCALANGQVWCWGAGATGGADTLVPVAIPNFPPPGRTVADLRAVEHLSCALLDDDSVWCWGDHVFANFSSVDPAPLPGLPVAGHHALSLRLSEMAVCVRLDDGEAMCTGYLQGLNSLAGTIVPGLAGAGDFSVGEGFACALDAQGAKCLGSNTFGALGDGSIAGESATAVHVALPVGIAPVAALSSAVSGWNSCARLTDGTAYCWGNNGDGQLGAGTFDSGHSIPVAVQGLSAAAEVTTSSTFTCARRSASLSCWGYGFFGQRGDGSAYRSQAQLVLDGDRLFSDGFDAAGP